MYINNDIDYLKFLNEKEIYIFGAGIKGKKYCYRLDKMGYNVIAFIDNNVEYHGKQCEKRDVISLNEYKNRWNEKAFIIVCSNNYETEIKMQLMEQCIYNFASSDQIDFGGGEDYYDDAYFEFQKPMGEFGGKFKTKYFKDYIKETDVLIEFGSGGGYLLKQLKAKEKIGIEINDVARMNAEKLGVNSVKTIAEIPDNYADVIISTSVLEHVENPMGVLRELRSKLKDDGKIIFHVPNESCETEYSKSEINNHLFTWNCLNIGNLFKAAGFFVCSVRGIKEMWPHNFLALDKQITPEMMDTFCVINGVANSNHSCLIVAKK